MLHLFEAAGLALVMLGLHPLAPLVIVAATLPSMATAYEFNNRVGSHLYSQTPEVRRLEYSRNVVLSPEPAKDVRLFGLGSFFRRRYDSAFEATTGEAQRPRQGLAPRVVAVEALETGMQQTDRNNEAVRKLNRDPVRENTRRARPPPLRGPEAEVPSPPRHAPCTGRRSGTLAG